MLNRVSPRLGRWVRLPSPMLLVVPALTLLSCMQYVDRYVSYQPVPGEATVVVVPLSTADADMKAADEVTGLTLGCRVSVLERPALYSERKALEGTSGSSGLAVAGTAIGVASGSSSVKSDVVTSADPVELLSRTDADYVIFVRSDANGYWLRIVRRDGGRVLFSGPLALEDSYTDVTLRKMMNILVLAGITKPQG